MALGEQIPKYVSTVQLQYSMSDSTLCLTIAFENLSKMLSYLHSNLGNILFVNWQHSPS